MSETEKLIPVDQQKIVLPLKIGDTLPLHKYSNQGVPLEKLTMWFYHAHCQEDNEEIEQLEMAIEEILQHNVKCAATISKKTTISNEIKTELLITQPRLVQLRVGARFWMDFQGWTWPDCPYGNADLVFTVSRSGVDNNSTLRGQGFGNPRPHYGNGSILAENADLIDLPNKTSPSVDTTEKTMTTRSCPKCSLLMARCDFKYCPDCGAPLDKLSPSNAPTCSPSFEL
jgi:hypothetical protein